MGRRDTVPQITVRVTPEEDAWLRTKATELGMSLAEVTRKCWSLGIPQLLGNEFLRRIDLDDARVRR